MVFEISQRGKGSATVPRSRGQGEMKFHPDRWARVYDHWMEGIKDWCISRQLWWGHRIASVVQSRVCFSETLTPKSNVKSEFASNEYIAQFRAGRNWEQDPDVLDTWFSSWLWPFATMGWPEKNGHAAKVLSDDRSGHRAGHYFLLGRAHDHGGLRIHGGHAVQECLFHRHHPRQAGAQNVQEPGQFAGPAGPHRQIRRGRAAVRRDALGAAGPGRALRRAAGRVGPQFLQQALERLPLPPASRRRSAGRNRSAPADQR
jgi:hypothetical protein